MSIIDSDHFLSGELHAQWLVVKWNMFSGIQIFLNNPLSLDYSAQRYSFEA